MRVRFTLSSCLGLTRQRGENLVLRTVSNDFTFLDNDNPVNQGQQGRPMGHDNQRLSDRCTGEVLEENRLGLAVHRTGRLVEQQKLRPGQEAAS